MDPVNAAAEITVRHNAEGRRYELVDAGRVVGAAHYVPFGGDERIFYHTTVDGSHGGRGLSARLAAFALDDTRALGQRIVAVCPYIRGYVAKHPEYREAVAPTRPDHLAAVPRG